MSNNILILYDFMKNNSAIVSKIKDMDEKKFFNNDECLSYSYGLISEIKKEFFKLNKQLIISNEIFSKIYREMYILDDKLLNSYNGINGYLAYDFIKTEYHLLLNELDKMLNI